MSGTVPITIGGAFNGVAGVVSIPSSLLFGAPSAGGSVNNLIQSYLNGLSQGSVNGTVNFSNVDLAGGTSVSAAGSVGGGPVLEEFTNVSNPGGVSVGSGPYTVAAGVTDLLVQIPGSGPITGTGTTTQAVFGANSNVTYSVTDPAAGSIFLAGGANSITLNTLFPNTTAESIYSAGADTINLAGQGTDYVSVYGNAVVLDQDANAFVTTEGNATTNFYWDNVNSGGQLHFTNNSSVAAFIHIGIFGSVGASAHVTASGGAGGGFYVGGSAGGNSLIGGSGVVTLVGAGPGDYLEANSSVGTNVLFAGPGNETLVASSTTGANQFYAGLNYPGLGQPQANGVISTAGSGAQSFSLGNVPGGESIFGSTSADTAMSNNYIVVSDATAGGGLLSIYNFVDNRSTIFLSNGAGGPGSATISSQYVDQGTPSQYDINLSDGTHIFLKGLTSTEMSNITTGTIPGGLTYIQG